MATASVPGKYRKTNSIAFSSIASSISSRVERDNRRVGTIAPYFTASSSIVSSIA